MVFCDCCTASAAVPEALSSMSAMEEEGGDQERLEDMLRDAEADRAAIMAKNAECVSGGPMPRLGVGMGLCMQSHKECG